MAQQKNSNVALCPECEGPVNLSGKLKIGQKFPCRRCGSVLMVFDRKPLELVLANEMGPIDGQSKVTKRKDNSLTQSSDTGEESLEMATTSNMSLANCPECSATLRFHRPLNERQLVVCPECNETLEVISLRPLKLHWANEDPWEYEEFEDPRYRTRNG